MSENLKNIIMNDTLNAASISRLLGRDITDKVRARDDKGIMLYTVIDFVANMLLMIIPIMYFSSYIIFAFSIGILLKVYLKKYPTNNIITTYRIVITFATYLLQILFVLNMWSYRNNYVYVLIFLTWIMWYSYIKLYPNCPNTMLILTHNDNIEELLKNTEIKIK